MTTIIKDYGKKFLSLVLALVMTLSLVNLAPFAEEAKAATTVTFKCEVSGVASDNAQIWVIEGDYTQTTSLYDANNGNKMLVGTAMTKVDDTTWTAEVTSETITFARVSGDGNNYYWGWLWNLTSRGSNTLYTATSGSEGSWSTPASTETFTLKLVDDTADNGNDTEGYNPYYIADASAIIKVFVDGTEYAVTAGATESKTAHGTTKNQVMSWTVDIPTTASSVVLQRINPSDTSVVWTELSVPMDTRGSNDTYAFQTNGTTGTWSSSTDEEQTTQATTESGSGNTGSGSDGSLATPLSGATYSVDAHEFNDQSDINPSPAEGAEVGELYLASAILYDYYNDTQIKAVKNGTSAWDATHTAFDENDKVESDLASDGAWKLQFYTYNSALINDYKVKGLITYPLYTGGFDSIKTWDNYTVYPPLQFLYSRATSDAYTADETDWRVNHGIENSSNTSVQGIVNKYLSTDGDLLTYQQYGSTGTYAVMPQFDDEYLTSNNLAAVYGSKENPVGFPFRKSLVKEGYYIFNSLSGLDNIKLVQDDSTDSGYALEYNSNASAQVKDNNGAVGYFPFNDGGDSYTTNRNELNYGVGTRVDIPFKVPSVTVDTNYQTIALMGGEGTFDGDGVCYSVEELFTLNPIGTGTKYVIIESDGLEGAGINIDYIKVGSTAYTMDGAVVMNNASYYSSNGSEVSTTFNGVGAGKIVNFSAPGGYVVIPVTANNETGITLGYREYTNYYNVNVMVVDSLDDVAGAISRVDDGSAQSGIKFEFTGDDDLWVYVDGVLVLDMGGAHAKASGVINFTSGYATANSAINISGGDIGAKTVTLSDLGLSFSDSTKQHTMTVFYMERGLYESNLKIEFNFEMITQKNGLTVDNTVDLSTINKGFSTGLSASDFSFLYDVYDATVWTAAGSGSEGKDTFYVNDTYGAGRVYITGSGSQTASVVRDIDAGEESLYGDQMKVTQDAGTYINGVFVQGLFDTSYVLTDSTGTVISTSENKANPYNVTDGTLDSDGADVTTENPTQDNYFTLKDSGEILDEAPEDLHLTAAYTNTARTNSISIVKTDNSIAHKSTDTYTFVVKYNKLLGVETTGTFTGDYKVVSKNTGSLIRTGTTEKDGKITISADEKIIIEGVPVNSSLMISEEDDGNFVETVVTVGSDTTKVDNTTYYATGNDTAAVYNWEVINGDQDTETYFAEVGTAIEINDGDELTLTTGEVTEDVTYVIPETTVTVTAPDDTAVTGGIDLIITDITWTTSDGDKAITAGEQVTFTVTVKNIGDTDVAAGTKIGIRIEVDGNTSAFMWADTLTTGLAAGETAEVTMNGGYNMDLYWTATDGSHSFLAYVDEGSLIGETNENNNTYTISFETPYTLEVEKTEELTYKYHEIISEVGKVDATIGEVSLDNGKIVYTYPADEAAGSDVFYYEISRVADAQVTDPSGNIVAEAGEVITTKTIPVVVNAYQAKEDVYVLDYGLPVSLSAEPNSIKGNDTLVLGGSATVTHEYGYIMNGTSLSTATPERGEYKSSATYGLEGTTVYGKASVDSAYTDYQYALGKFLEGSDMFYYGMQVTAENTDMSGTLNAKNATPVMNAKVTVIPANVVYYEDNFSYSTTDGTTSAITYTLTGDAVINTTGYATTVEGYEQSNALDGIYGYDEAYAKQLTDSFGSTTLYDGSIVEFTFQGTGVDVIAATTQSTAAVLFAVYSLDANGDIVDAPAFGIVDTYYVNGSLYQLPVISVDLNEIAKDDGTGVYGYGTYKVKLKIMKTNFAADGLFYLDGIRIYNPLGDNVPTVDSNGNIVTENGVPVYGEEYQAKFVSVRDMLLGDCTLSEDTITKADGTVITNTVVPGSTAKITGDQVTEKGSIASLVEALQSAPNHEVYLATGSNLEFSVTDNDKMAGNGILQVELKAVQTGTGVNANEANLTVSINGTEVVINTSTPMYYNVTPDTDGKVVITGATNNGYNLCLTNIKYAGYTLVENTVDATTADVAYITDIAFDGGSVREYDATITSKTRADVNITFSEEVTVTTCNDEVGTLKLYVNGIQSVYYFDSSVVDGNQDSTTEVTGTTIPVEIIAPNAAGIYSYEFVYTDAAGNVATKTVSVSVTPKSSRK